MQDTTENQNTLFLLPLLWNHRKKIILYTLLGTVLIILYSIIAPHSYKSTTKVIANDTKSGGLSALMTGLPAYLSVGSSASIPVLTVNEILTSRSNTEYIIKKCGLDTIEPFSGLSIDERIELVSRIVTSDAKRASGVIILECSISTPYFPSKEQQTYTANLAAKICNTAIEGLDKINREKNTSTARRTRLYIERVLAQNLLKLDSVQNALVNYQKSNKLLVADEQAKSLIASTVEIGTLLAKSELELKLALQEYQNNAPIVTTLQKRVSVLRKQFEDAQNGGSVDSDQLSIPVSKIPGVSKGYFNLLRDVKIMEQMNAYLETQRMQESIQEERDLPTIQIVDMAAPVLKRVAPARTFMVIIGLIVSLLVSILIVILHQLVMNWWNVSKKDFQKV